MTGRAGEHKWNFSRACPEKKIVMQHTSSFPIYKYINCSYIYRNSNLNTGAKIGWMCEWKLFRNSPIFKTCLLCHMCAAAAAAVAVGAAKLFFNSKLLFHKCDESAFANCVCVCVCISLHVYIVRGIAMRWIIRCFFKIYF